MKEKTTFAKLVEKDNLIKKTKVGIALMPETEFIKACLPLFQTEQIEVVEWSFDTILNQNLQPEWITGLLNEFGNQNLLLGHGVYYSLFDANWTTRQETWLEKLKTETQKHQYNHISEHFGFMSSQNYHSGVPLPVSLTKTTLNIGIDRIKRLQNAVQLPVGIENLAFAFSKTDVEEQGVFIEKIIDSVGGFVILDLHNLYCQSHNFEIDLLDLIKLYPLNEVKEIHVSGGSWQQSLYQKNKKIRRDTHDGAIPEEIFAVLPTVISKCKNLEFIIFEQLGNSFKTENQVNQYQTDFKKLKQIVNQQNYCATNKIWHKNYELEKNPIVDLKLHNEQKILAESLLKNKNCNEIHKLNLENWNVKTWNLEMINTAILISEKWSLESH